MPVLTANRPVVFRFIARNVLRSFKKLINQSVIRFGIILLCNYILIFNLKLYQTRRRRLCLKVLLLCLFLVYKSCEPVRLTTPELIL